MYGKRAERSVLRHGQITIPKDIRELGLEDNDLCQVTVSRGGLLLKQIRALPSAGSPWLRISTSFYASSGELHRRWNERRGDCTRHRRSYPRLAQSGGGNVRALRESRPARYRPCACPPRSCRHMGTSRLRHGNSRTFSAPRSSTNSAGRATSDWQEVPEAPDNGRRSSSLSHMQRADVIEPRSVPRVFTRCGYDQVLRARSRGKPPTL
jgi:hypothetical protein